MINHLAPPTGGGVLEVCRPQFDGECNYEEARKDAARRARFCRRVHRPRPAGGLYAAEHHRRTAGRHRTQSGYGDTADRPGGAVTRGWLERGTALGPFAVKASVAWPKYSSVVRVSISRNTSFSPRSWRAARGSSVMNTAAAACAVGIDAMPGQARLHPPADADRSPGGSRKVGLAV